MKKAGGIFLIVIGIVLIIISILALLQAFEVFRAIGTESETLAYVFGSVVFPLLITVIGRWIYRKGTTILRNKDKRAA